MPQETLHAVHGPVTHLCLWGVDGDTDGDGGSVSDGDSDGRRDNDGDGDDGSVSDGDSDGSGDNDGDGDGGRDNDGDSDGGRVSDSDGDGDGSRDSDSDGDDDSETAAEALLVGVVEYDAVQLEVSVTVASAPVHATLPLTDVCPTAQVPLQFADDKPGALPYRPDAHSTHAAEPEREY